MSTQRKSVNVTIPKVLHDKIKKRIEGTSFRSVSEYVTHLVREEEERTQRKNTQS